MELTGLVGQEEADNVGLQLSEHVGTERCSDNSYQCNMYYKSTNEGAWSSNFSCLHTLLLDLDVRLTAFG